MSENSSLTLDQTRLPRTTVPPPSAAGRKSPPPAGILQWDPKIHPRFLSLSSPQIHPQFTSNRHQSVRILDQKSGQNLNSHKSNQIHTLYSPNPPLPESLFRIFRMLPRILDLKTGGTLRNLGFLKFSPILESRARARLRDNVFVCCLLKNTRSHHSGVDSI